jgi:hypothetical protein
VVESVDVGGVDVEGGLVVLLLLFCFSKLLVAEGTIIVSFEVA